MDATNKSTAALIGLAGTVITALIVYQGGSLSTKSSVRETDLARIRELETDRRELIGENASLNAQIAMLQAQLRFEYGMTPLEALEDFITHFPIPAWFKQWNPETQEFVMVAINIHYEQFYGVTRAKYKGSTDFDIYPQALAQAYYENDLDVLVDRKDELFTETIRNASGEILDIDFYKFWVDLPDGTEFVAGIQVEK